MGYREEKLTEVGLTTLADRRHRGDMLETFKILNEIDDVDYHLWFSKVDEQHQRTRQAVTILSDGSTVGSENLMKPKSRLEIRKDFFSCRVVDGWNNLPDEVKKSGNVDEFKINFDDHMGGK